MSEVALRLQTIYDSSLVKPTMRRKSSVSGVIDEDLVDKAHAFASRVGGTDANTRMEELRTEVKALLGKDAVGVVTGVYNPARLYRFLMNCQMDVQDAKSAVVLNNNSRVEFEMDAKRMSISESHSIEGFLQSSRRDICV